MRRGRFDFDSLAFAYGQSPVPAANNPNPAGYFSPQMLQGIMAMIPGLSDEDKAKLFGTAGAEEALKGISKQVKNYNQMINLPFYLAVRQMKQVLSQGQGQGELGLGGNVAGGATPMQQGMAPMQGAVGPRMTGGQLNPGGLPTPGVMGG